MAFHYSSNQALLLLLYRLTPTQEAESQQSVQRTTVPSKLTEEAFKCFHCWAYGHLGNQWLSVRVRSTGAISPDLPTSHTKLETIIALTCKFAKTKNEQRYFYLLAHSCCLTRAKAQESERTSDPLSSQRAITHVIIDHGYHLSQNQSYFMASPALLSNIGLVGHYFNQPALFHSPTAATTVRHINLCVIVGSIHKIMLRQHESPIPWRGHLLVFIWFCFQPSKLCPLWFARRHLQNAVISAQIVWKSMEKKTQKLLKLMKHHYETGNFDKTSSRDRQKCLNVELLHKFRHVRDGAIYENCWRCDVNFLPSSVNLCEIFPSITVVQLEALWWGYSSSIVGRARAPKTESISWDSASELSGVPTVCIPGWNGLIYVKWVRNCCRWFNSQPSIKTFGLESEEDHQTGSQTLSSTSWWLDDSSWWLDCRAVGVSRWKRCMWENR